MNDLKEKLREQWLMTWSRIQESTAYNQFSEKFHDLSPSAQKALLAGIGFLIALMIFAIPYSFYSASQDSLADVDNKKSLMRELFRVTRADQALPPMPETLDSGALEARARTVISGASLQPEQMGPFDHFAANGGIGASLPKTIEKNGLAVTLKKLNVRQLVDLGSKLQGIAPTVKMIGVDITASRPDPHYFDVTYKMVGFNLPPEPVAKIPAKGAKKPSGSKPADSEE